MYPSWGVFNEPATLYVWIKESNACFAHTRCDCTVRSTVHTAQWIVGNHPIWPLLFVQRYDWRALWVQKTPFTARANFLLNTMWYIWFYLDNTRLNKFLVSWTRGYRHTRTQGDHVGLAWEPIGASRYLFFYARSEKSVVEAPWWCRYHYFSAGIELSLATSFHLKTWVSEWKEDGSDLIHSISLQSQGTQPSRLYNIYSAITRYSFPQSLMTQLAMDPFTGKPEMTLRMKTSNQNMLLLGGIHNSIPTHIQIHTCCHFEHGYWQREYRCPYGWSKR